MNRLLLLLTLLFAALSASAQTTLIATGSVWKYRDNGSDQGTVWIATNFNDSSWSSGPAQLGYGDGDEATTNSFGGVTTDKYITTYYRRAFTLANHAVFTNLLVRLLRDDGAIVYLNETEVFRSNMPNGPVNYRTTALANAGDDGKDFQTKIIDAGLLRDGTNVVAVEIHQNTNTSTDISFDLALIANVIFTPPGVTMTHWPLRGGGNGHFYEAVVSSGIAWSPAGTAATNRGGYLATVTSAAENQIIFNLIRDNTNLWVRRPSGDGWGPWLGAVQPPGSPEPGGGWIWITGEPFSYQHWNVGEPSNDLGAEDRIHFIGEGTLVGDAWNDSTSGNGAIRSYVVEFEQSLEPAPLVELRFNETGTNVANTGRASVSPVFFNSSDVPTDWHSESSLGISGLVGDRAFDNTASTGMGSGGSGGRASEQYDTAVDGLLSLTLQGWFKTESVVGSNARFFAKQGTGSGFLFLAPGTGVLSLEINGSASTMSSAQFSEVGQWTFFAVTYDGTVGANNVKFYKGTPSNAVTLVETRSLGTGRAATNSSGATFGNANGLQRPIDGLLDNMRIFGSKTDSRGALTAAQLEWFRNKDIQNAPDVVVLSASRSNGTLIISWPVYPGGLRLETSSNLATPLAWQAVTNTPAVNGDQNIVTIALAESFAAFRLARSAP